MSNGTNWKDIQNNAEAAKKWRVQKQQEITHERSKSNPDQILKTIEKVEEKTLEKKSELIVQNPIFEEKKNELANMKDAALGEDEIRSKYIREVVDEI